QGDRTSPARKEAPGAASSSGGCSSPPNTAVPRTPASSSGSSALPVTSKRSATKPFAPTRHSTRYAPRIGTPSRRLTGPVPARTLSFSRGSARIGNDAVEPAGSVTTQAKSVESPAALSGTVASAKSVSNPPVSNAWAGADRPASPIFAEENRSRLPDGLTGAGAATTSNPAAAIWLSLCQQETL